jgi:hypothetical protein
MLRAVVGIDFENTEEFFFEDGLEIIARPAGQKHYSSLPSATIGGTVLLGLRWVDRGSDRSVGRRTVNIRPQLAAPESNERN